MDKSLCNSDKYAVFVFFEGSLFSEKIRASKLIGPAYMIGNISTW
jgi:hypothetical protein